MTLCCLTSNTKTRLYANSGSQHMCLCGVTVPPEPADWSLVMSARGTSSPQTLNLHKIKRSLYISIHKMGIEKKMKKKKRKKERRKKSTSSLLISLCQRKKRPLYLIQPSLPTTVMVLSPVSLSIDMKSSWFLGTSHHLFWYTTQA